MKKLLFTVCALAALWMIPTLASATHIDSLEATADCEGWSVDFRGIFLNNDSTADLTFSVVLSEPDGTEVERADVAETISTDGTTYWALFHYEGTWDAELCGDYTALLDLTVVPDYGTDVGHFTRDFAFTCECDEEYGCTYTPGYWKNHLENWPLETVLVGANELSQSEAMAVLNTPVGGDATIILGYHLIAATLNVAYGADPVIQSAIDEANDLLTEYPLGSKPKGDAKEMLLSVKDELVAYNEIPCPEDDMDWDDDMEKSMGAVDETSWGSLKAFYR